MSHVTTVDIEIKDLGALAEAAEQCGCELVEGVTKYKWYGRHMGDYALPAGFTKEQLGKCDHIIRVKGADKRTYEIGVVERDGQYVLLFDFWQKGYGLMKKVCHADDKKLQVPEKLMQEYAAAVAIKKLKRQGRRVTRKVGEDGRIKLVAKGR